MDERLDPGREEMSRECAEFSSAASTDRTAHEGCDLDFFATGEKTAGGEERFTPRVGACDVN